MDQLIDLIDRGILKALRFPNMPFDSSSQGLFSLAIMLAHAKLYSDGLSENIRRGIHQKVRNGIWPQYAPVGYLNENAAGSLSLTLTAGHWFAKLSSYMPLEILRSTACGKRSMAWGSTLTMARPFRARSIIACFKILFTAE